MPSAPFSTPTARSRGRHLAGDGANADERPPADANSTLVEVKAVDANYPLFGTVVTDPACRCRRCSRSNSGVFGAAVDPDIADAA